MDFARLTDWFRQHSSRITPCLNGMILLGVFGVFLFFSCLTPYVYDDIAGHFCRISGKSFFDITPGVTPEISNFRDVLSSTRVQFESWGGRVIVTFVTYTIFLWGKMVFNVLNGVFAAGVVWMICRHICGKDPVRPGLLVLIASLFFLCAPAPGLTFFWTSGAITYLWTAFFYLLLLYPYRKYLAGEEEQKGNCLSHLFLIPAGLIGCNANETIAGTVLLLLIAVILDAAWRKRRVPVWMFYGLAGAAAGAAILLGAPGNSARIAYEGHSGIPFLANLFTQTAHLFHTIPALFALILAAAVFRYRVMDAVSRKIGIFYLLAILAAGYSMVFSPYTPGRAVFGAFIFMLCCAGYFWQCAGLPEEYRRIISAGIAVIAVMNMAFALRDIQFTNQICRARFAVMEEAQRRGESKDWVFRPTCGMSRYNVLYKTDLMRDDSTHFLNQYFARKYGQSSILLTSSPAIQGMSADIFPAGENR